MGRDEQSLQSPVPKQRLLKKRTLREVELPSAPSCHCSRRQAVMAETMTVMQCSEEKLRGSALLSAEAEGTQHEKKILTCQIQGPVFKNTKSNRSRKVSEGKME